MPQRRRTPEQKEAAKKAWRNSMASFSAMASFQARGFSSQTIDALTAHGIDAPERLLFATEADLENIPGIGKASFAEITRYRARFIPER